MSNALPASALKVQTELEKFGIHSRVKELTESTRTAMEAAEAVGCDVAQIVKSVIFRGKGSGRHLLVVTSGANRVDEKRLAALAGEKIGRADADFVREKTGYVIGGVPPLAHKEEPITFIDRDLLDYGEIWAAAGTPNTLFHLTPAELEKITGGTVADVRQEPLSP